MPERSDSFEPPDPYHSVLFRKWLITLGLVLGGALLVHGAGPGGVPGEAASRLPMMVTTFVVLLFGSALVSSSETALFSLDKLDLSQLKNSASWFDRTVLRLLEAPNDTLITILILNNLINVGVSLTAGAISDHYFGANLSAQGLAVAAFLATSFILIFGEIIPKILATYFSRLLARCLAPMLAGFAWVLRPAHKTIGWGLTHLFTRLEIPEETPHDNVSPDELKAIIQSDELTEVLEKDEREMIDGILELRNLVASDIMTPRTDVMTLSDNYNQPEMVAALKNNAHSRVLVCHGSHDEPIGFLLTKQILLDAEGDWRNHMRAPICVPEQVGLLDLLKLFRQQRTKIAVVIDEYGGTAGIVTLHDLLENIVGDIYEKHELTQAQISKVKPHLWRIAGQIELDEVGKALGISFPENKGKTLGGFVMNMAGQVPEVGRCVEYENITIVVEQMAGHRILQLLVENLDKSGKEGDV